MVRQELLEKITENDVKRAIKGMLDSFGIWNFPITQSLGSYKGIPDRFAIHKGVVYAIEVKRPKGSRLSDSQKEFQELWRKHYDYYHVQDTTYIVARSAEDVFVGMGL